MVALAAMGGLRLRAARPGGAPARRVNAPHVQLRGDGELLRGRDAPAGPTGRSVAVRSALAEPGASPKRRGAAARAAADAAARRGRAARSRGGAAAARRPR